MEKYVKGVEEKQKIEAEVKQKIAEDKLKRHHETLDKLKQKGEERKAKIAEAEKAYKEINR